MLQGPAQRTAQGDAGKDEPTHLFIGLGNARGEDPESVPELCVRALQFGELAPQQPAGMRGYGLAWNETQVVKCVTSAGRGPAAYPVSF